MTKNLKQTSGALTVFSHQGTSKTESTNIHRKKKLLKYFFITKKKYNFAQFGEL